MSVNENIEDNMFNINRERERKHFQTKKNVAISIEGMVEDIDVTHITMKDSMVNDNKVEANGVYEYCCYVDKINKPDVSVKFDTAASSNMSGIKNRIKHPEKISDDNAIRIVGFNGSSSAPTHLGLNSDGKKEYFVPSMPQKLVLLCAHAYSSEGATILHKNGGIVLTLDDEELGDLLEFVQHYPVSKRLKVKNRTYEVDDGMVEKLQEEAKLANTTNEECYSNTATRYFNTKVNVSNSTERILTLLLTGLSFQDWYSHVQHGSLEGIPGKVTTTMLNSFENKYGRTPDFIRLALPLKEKNKRGLMAEPTILTKCGQRIEIDVMDSDFNELDLNTNSEENNSTRKLPSHGGAIAAAVCVDCYSGFVHGKLLQRTRNSIEYVKEFVELYELDNIKITTLASDSGVVTQSMYQVVTPAVVNYLRFKGIHSERAEPYNHSRGTGTVERTIRTIKELMRMAMAYILRNPNLSALGFTTKQILKLWGELFLWAIVINNLKICSMDNNYSKYEMYKKSKPNMQNIRLLPICSVILVYAEKNHDAYSNQPEHQIGLYVGPALSTPGAIRAAIRCGDRIVIKVTSRFTSATDGGGINIYTNINNHIPMFLKETNIENNNNTINNTEGVVPANVSDQDMSPVPTTVNNNSTTIWDTKVNEVVNVRRSNRKRKKSAKLLANDIGEDSITEQDNPIQACMADWSTHTVEECYYSFIDNQYLMISENIDSEDMLKNYKLEEGCKAVTVGVPKTFTEALKDPLWGPAARTELNTLLETKAIVQVDPKMAEQAIKMNESDLLILFPVYEVKEREGETVYKVRLVGDGRTHHHAGDTYSATPSREELLILLHLIATLDWSYAHIDEKRAFLNAPHLGKNDAYAKFRDDHMTYYKILAALYGMKSAPSDYQAHVANRFNELKYKRLAMCSCIYVLKNEDNSKIIVVYAFVDDFIFAGNDHTFLESKISEFRNIAQTTTPIWNPEIILGIELKRIIEKNIITCSMESKIKETCEKFSINSTGKERSVPIPTHGFIVKDYEFEALPETSSGFLNAKDTQKYMAIVGALVWISGIRFDIIFSVMYLSWFTKKPRKHHLKMAIHVLTYLLQTKDLPLVIGGKTDNEQVRIVGYTDASLGTAPKGRSATGHMIKLSPHSGSIMAKSKTTTCVVMSSFESELDGASLALKSVSRVENILKELQIEMNHKPLLYSDNKAMIEFIKGKGIAKGVRHMELRMWYLREKVKKGDVDIEHTSGLTLPADKLTKLGDKEGHHKFRFNIMGLGLLQDNNNIIKSQNKELDSTN